VIVHVPGVDELGAIGIEPLLITICVPLIDGVPPVHVVTGVNVVKICPTPVIVAISSVNELIVAADVVDEFCNETVTVV
jgi:hypothetical protein